MFEKAKIKSKGFTLIELLVVISIIGLLASVVLVSLNSARIKARDARRLADMKQMQTALGLYYQNNDRYPDGDFENGSPPTGCYGWDSSSKGTFISSLVIGNIMKKTAIDPSNSGAYCFGADDKEYYYYRYGSGYCSDVCNGKPFYILGAFTMEALSSHRPTGKHPNSPGWACHATGWTFGPPADPSYRDWNGEFDWVAGSCE